MNVAIFDVDGTLTQTTGVDDTSLVHAFEQTFDLRLPPLDWADFFHSTDEGLCLEICQRYLGRHPTPEQVASAKQTFLANLRRRIEQDPELCRPVPGACALLDRLRQDGWRVGLASGAWPESARLKLNCAGVSCKDLPGTFSHAHADGRPAVREEIVGATIRELLGVEPHERQPGTRIVYVGDGVWDARAARSLGIGFLGVRHDGREDRLRREGAETIVANFLDLERVLEHLRTIRILVWGEQSPTETRNSGPFPFGSNHRIADARRRSSHLSPLPMRPSPLLLFHKDLRSLSV